MAQSSPGDSCVSLAIVVGQISSFGMLGREEPPLEGFFSAYPLLRANAMHDIKQTWRYRYTTPDLIITTLSNHTFWESYRPAAIAKVGPNLSPALRSRF